MPVGVMMNSGNNSHNKDNGTVTTMVVVVVHVIAEHSRALRGVVWHSRAWVDAVDTAGCNIDTSSGSDLASTIAEELQCSACSHGR